MAGEEVFNRYFRKYDEWYEKNRSVYLSEIEALKLFVNGKGKGLDIGTGTGRFAIPLGVKFGVEPSFNMAAVAKKRGVEVIAGVGEKLPFKDGVFDFVLIVVSICFFDNPLKALREAKRVLKPYGNIVIGFVDRDSFLGEYYLRKKDKSIFYRKARFFSTKEVASLLEEVGFSKFSFVQTLFDLPETLSDIQYPEMGYGKGGFVVVKGESV